MFEVFLTVMVSAISNYLLSESTAFHPVLRGSTEVRSPLVHATLLAPLLTPPPPVCAHHQAHGRRRGCREPPGVHEHRHWKRSGVDLTLGRFTSRSFSFVDLERLHQAPSPGGYHL